MKFRIFFVALMLAFALPFVLGQSTTATVCCEKTTSGAFCQNVPASACASDSRQAPTSCDSTSFCRSGTCYDSNEGTCLDNTPQIVCNTNGGIWNQTSPAQCGLGCCTLGDQAAFVTLVRCKKLSSFLGLQTNYNTGITNELSCVQSVKNQDKGACVYDFEFEKTCKFTTRADCDGTTKSNNGTSASGTFYKDKLCSAEDLGTNCGPSTKTTCLPGKDEVYFLDTCGNPANVYDASKLSNKDYWSNVKSKDESCNPSGSNAGSSTCGNCNYLSGSFCRASNITQSKPAYGNYVCANLNCVDENGKTRLHGESWCANDDSKTGQSDNTVGSRFFREICQNGEVVTEPCKDFRAETCVQGAIQTSAGPFSQAACRVNRWQDCLAQTSQQDCENGDRRDCTWKPGLKLSNETINGVCIPKDSPGFNFWADEETKTICGQGNKACVVTYKKGLFGGEECVSNCECLTESWRNSYANVCSALGDCGPGTNWAGQNGYKEGFNVSINKLKKTG